MTIVIVCHTILETTFPARSEAVAGGPGCSELLATEAVDVLTQESHFFQETRRERSSTVSDSQSLSIWRGFAGWIQALFVSPTLALTRPRRADLTCSHVFVLRATQVLPPLYTCLRWGSGSSAGIWAARCKRCACAQSHACCAHTLLMR